VRFSADWKTESEFGQVPLSRIFWHYRVFEKNDSASFNNQKGLTLIEISIAVAIVAVMAAIAVPNFIRDQPNYELKQACRDTVSRR